MSRRLIAVSLLTALAMGACAPTLKDVRAGLTAESRGRIAFATPDTLARGDGRLVPAGPVALTGELTLPAGPGPFAAVVLMHGCGGLGNAEGGWVEPLTRAGYATFVVDSLTWRGLREVCAPDPRHASAARCRAHRADGLFTRRRRDARSVDPLGA